MAQLGDIGSKPPQPAVKPAARPARAKEAARPPQDGENRETGIRKFGEALKRQRLLRDGAKPEGLVEQGRPIQQGTAERIRMPDDRASGEDSGQAEEGLHRQASQLIESGARFQAGSDPLAGLQVRPAGTAADAAAFADYVARLALSPQRDEQRLRLAFSQNGWPVSDLTLSRTADGRLMLVLGVEPGQHRRVERRLEDLRERLAARQGGAERLELVAISDGVTL